MSDFEDEMDVDGPPPSKDVTFSSETSKGKRSAANLPVEAEDTLPWFVQDEFGVYTKFINTDTILGSRSIGQ
jgi:hypothetical protein